MKWIVVVNGQGVPLLAHLDSASPSEVTLLETTIDKITVLRAGRGRSRKESKRIIADKGYGSNPLPERLGHCGIDLICLYRKKNQKKEYRLDRGADPQVVMSLCSVFKFWLGPSRLPVLARRPELRSVSSR